MGFLFIGVNKILFINKYIHILLKKGNIFYSYNIKNKTKKHRHFKLTEIDQVKRTSGMVCTCGKRIAWQVANDAKILHLLRSLYSRQDLYSWHSSPKIELEEFLKK